MTGRILALDYGKRRIGLAVTDELGLTAQGLETLHRTRLRDDLDALAGIIERLGVTQIVMGDPRHLSGDLSRGSASVREFGERLAKQTGREIVYLDERLTSAQAQRLMRESGASLKQRSQAVDRLSAQLLLETYMTATAENQFSED